MNTQVISIQFSVFGDFKNLNPSNPDMVIDFMNMLKDDDFVPSTFGEIPFNSNKIMMYNRFSFSNKDGVTINIGSDRLDVIFGYNEDGKYKEMNFEELKNKGLEYIAKIKSKYNKIINRIALNITKMYDENLSSIIREKFDNSIILPYYKENTPLEWNERLVYRMSSDFKNDINVGLNLTKSQGKLTKKDVSIEFDGIIALFDINTVFNNTENYSEDDLEDFFEKANIEYNKLIKSIEE